MEFRSERQSPWESPERALPFIIKNMAFMIKKNKFQDETAFTLMEIIVVVIIIGILASMALPQYHIAVERVRSGEGVHILETVLNSEQRWATDNNNTFTNDITNLDVSYSGFGNFNAIIASDFASPLPAPGVNSELVQIRRNAAAPFDYTLHITATGVISCTGGGGSICTKMGY